MKNGSGLVVWTGRACAAMAVGWALGAVSLPTQAATAATLAYTWPVSVAAADGAKPGRKAPKPKKARKAKQTQPAAQPERTPSGETVTDRERRLTRECKGRPNAGACLGFAS